MHPHWRIREMLSSLRISTNANENCKLKLCSECFQVQYNFRVYAILSAICILLSAICFPAGQKAGSNARRHLHQQLIAAVLKNPIHFFQTVPLGRIMNRLSIDIAVVDKVCASGCIFYKSQLSNLQPFTENRCNKSKAAAVYPFVPLCCAHK